MRIFHPNLTVRECVDLLLSRYYDRVLPSLSVGVRIFPVPFSLSLSLAIPPYLSFSAVLALSFSPLSWISRPSSTTSRKPCQSIIDPPQSDLREAKAEPSTTNYSSSILFSRPIFCTVRFYIALYGRRRCGIMR